MTTLILDANILIRAVLGRRVFSLIDRYHRSARFVTPSVCIDDARKYLPKILASRPHPNEGAETLDHLLIWVEPIDMAIMTPLELPAKRLLVRRDPDDWPLLAAAWSLDAPIWSEDQDFFGLGVPVWNSASVEFYLSGQLSTWLRGADDIIVPDN